jgi:hypothetical protein
MSLDRVVADEVVTGGPVRDFRWYKRRKFYSGWCWSATMGSLVAYESQLELARIATHQLCDGPPHQPRPG